MDSNECDVAVVGGGLAGLSAAALLARRGLGVVLFERAGTLGGRAGTRVRNGFCFNEGAHALYRGGGAARVLSSLGVQFTGKQPPPSGLAVRDGAVFSLPATAGALMTTGLLTWSAKLQGAKLLARLRAFDTRALDDVSWQDWASRILPDAAMRSVIDAFIRVSTYTNAPALLSAGAAIDQLRQAQSPGVLYVDGGWVTLVEGTASAARAAGADLRSHTKVVCAASRGARWSVAIEGGESVTCRALLLAVGPTLARSIVSSDELARWAERATLTRASCLDVALSRLPNQHATFALGVDCPLYFSVHSRVAKVAPPGQVLVSTMKYLAPGEVVDKKRDQAELEGWLELLQPGWRDVEIERQWLPAMVTSNALVTASGGGVAGRPGPAVPDAPGVFVAGDWAGREGMLLDAAMASAGCAVDQIASQLAMAKVA